MDGWVGRWMGGWMDGWVDGWMIPWRKRLAPYTYGRGSVVPELDGQGKGAAVGQGRLGLGGVGDAPEGSAEGLVDVCPVERVWFLRGVIVVVVFIVVVVVVSLDVFDINLLVISL